MKRLELSHAAEFCLAPAAGGSSICPESDVKGSCRESFALPVRTSFRQTFLQHLPFSSFFFEAVRGPLPQNLIDLTRLNW